MLERLVEITEIISNSKAGETDRRICLIVEFDKDSGAEPRYETLVEAWQRVLQTVLDAYYLAKAEVNAVELVEPFWRKQSQQVIRMAHRFGVG